MQAPAPPAAAAALARAQELLGSQLRVTLSDGRVLLGRLHCLDWKQNILLRDTAEVAQAGSPGRKALGLVAVEARHVTRYEVEAPAAAGGGAAGAP